MPKLLLLTSIIVPSLLPAATAHIGFASTPQRPRPWDKVNEIPVGAAAPDWRLKTVDGETVALSELRGKIVVVDFWANWCGPCRKLEPLFDQLVREYREKPVRFFTMSIWPDADFNAKAYLKLHNMASTFLNGDNKVASDYGIWGVPTYYVIDANGKISYIHVLLSVDPEALGRRLREAIGHALTKYGDHTSATSASARKGSLPRTALTRVSNSK